MWQNLCLIKVLPTRGFFSTHLGILPEKTYLLQKDLYECGDDSKVFVMYDPPHLLKSVRNNLCNHDFFVGENRVSWSHWDICINLRVRRHCINLLSPDLRKCLQFNHMEKMNVSNSRAAQVFSNIWQPMCVLGKILQWTVVKKKGQKKNRKLLKLQHLWTLSWTFLTGSLLKWWSSLVIK